MKTTKNIKNLLKRGERYYCRVTAPVKLRQLRSALGVQSADDVVRALNTSDKREALYRLPAIQAEILQEFADELSKLETKGASLSPLNAHVVQRAAFGFATSENQLDAEERRRRPSAQSIEDAERGLLKRGEQAEREMADGLSRERALLHLIASDEHTRHSAFINWKVRRAENRQALREALQENLAESEYPLVDFQVKQVIHEEGLDVLPDSVDYRELGCELTKAWLRALKVQDARDKGDYEQEERLLGELRSLAPSVSSVDASGAVSEVVVDLGRVRGRKVRPGSVLRDHFDNYLRETRKGAQPSALKDLRATFRQFIECVGEKAPDEYTKQDVVKFKQGLACFPANATRRFPGKTFNQIVELARKEGLRPISTNTARGKLSQIAVFGRWLENNADGVDGTKFETTAPPRTDRQSMRAFPADEIVKILNANAFTGAKSPHDYSEAGDFRLRDWHYWLVLIAAFSGARANEIVQLEVGDVISQDGILCFNLNTENGKSLKTAASKRLIPVHPQLIDLGIERYLEESIQAGSLHLLRGIPAGTNGRRSTAATRWFGKFLGKIGVKVEGDSQDRGGTHRWRHTFADKIRQSGGLEYQVSLILGHHLNHAAATSDYGQETTMGVQQRYEVISKVAYPGVDFEKLK